MLESALLGELLPVAQVNLMNCLMRAAPLALSVRGQMGSIVCLKAGRRK